MTIEQAFSARISATAAITALVQTTRIYQLQLRQSTGYPAILVQLITDLTDYHNRGEIDVTETRIQTDCYGYQEATSLLTDPYGSVCALADLVNDAVTGEPFSIGDKRFLGVFRIDREVSAEGDATKLIRVRQDFRVMAKTV